MQHLDFLNDRNLVFVDIEATDDKEDRKIIQFSGIKVNIDQTIEDLNITLNPEQNLSNHIINLLKIDDDYLKSCPRLKDVKNEIIDFIKNTTIITFGNFDINILKNKLNIDKEHDIKWFDFQHYLKRYSKNQVPLLQFYNLIKNGNMDSIQKLFCHNALYDAEMLKESFYAVWNMTEEEVQNYCVLSHIMPRYVYPKHKIFSKKELNNKDENIVNPKNNIVLIKDINFRSLEIKKNGVKTKLPYLDRMKYQTKDYKWRKFNNNIQVGPHTYDFYLDNLKNFLSGFLKEIKESPIICDNVSKEKMTNLTEIIYDCLKIYTNINYINLKTKKKYPKFLIDYYYEIVNNQEQKIQEKFLNFWDFKSFDK